jgi:hypothetical protein
MREQFPPITINFAPVKVIGIPGLSLVAIAVAIAIEFPEGRWLLLSGMAGGIALGVALILIRRRTDSNDGPRGRSTIGGLPSTGQDARPTARPSPSDPASALDPSSTSPKTSFASGFSAWQPDPSW